MPSGFMTVNCDYMALSHINAGLIRTGTCTGSIALMVALGNAVRIDHCVMDGGITPYQLLWIITRLIAVRDFAMVMLGRWKRVGSGRGQRVSATE